MVIYWFIFEKVKGFILCLIKIDDEIYEYFKIDFFEFDFVVIIDEDEMKSKIGKERWCKFLMVYDKRVDDYNFGIMLCFNFKVEYIEEDIIFGMFWLKEWILLRIDY